MVLAIALTLAGCASGGSSSSAGNATATPTFSPSGGIYNSPQTVTLADSTSGAVFYCTTDGTAPTSSSPKCSQPVTVSKSEFLQVLAVAPGGTSSQVASAGYTIDLSAAATPTFSPTGGAYTSAQTVTISDKTPGVNLFYTLDGSTPTGSSALYTGPITVSKSETLSAIAIAPAFNNSGVASAAFKISAGNTATPMISPAGGSFTTSQQVTIADATAAATIYYTAGTLLGGQYLGFVYGAGVFANAAVGTGWSSHLVSFGSSTMPSSCASIITSTATIYGGDFTNDDPSTSSNGFGNSNLAIDLGAQDPANNGLFPKATVCLGGNYAANTAKKTYTFQAVAIAGHQFD